MPDEREGGGAPPPEEEQGREKGAGRWSPKAALGRRAERTRTENRHAGPPGARMRELGLWNEAWHGMGRKEQLNLNGRIVDSVVGGYERDELPSAGKKSYTLTHVEVAPRTRDGVIAATYAFEPPEEALLPSFVINEDGVLGIRDGDKVRLLGGELPDDQLIPLLHNALDVYQSVGKYSFHADAERTTVDVRATAGLEAFRRAHSRLAQFLPQPEHTEEAQRSPLEQARALGLKRPDGSEITDESELAESVHRAFVAGFEGKQFLEPSDESYILGALDITNATNTLDVAYGLLSPEGSSLPVLVIADKGVTVLDEDDRELHNEDADTRQDFLRGALAGFEQIKGKGVSTNLLEPAVSFPEELTDARGREQLVELIRKFPKSYALIPKALIPEAVRVEAETVAREGANFQEGLRIYAQQQEQEALPQDPVEASLHRAIQALLWTKNEDGDIVPGPLLIEQNRSVLERLDGNRRIGENLDSHAVNTLKSIEGTLRQIVQIQHAGSERQLVFPLPWFSTQRLEYQDRVDSPPRQPIISEKELVVAQPNEACIISLSVYPEGYFGEIPVLTEQGTPTDTTLAAEPVLRIALTDPTLGQTSKENTSYFFPMTYGVVNQNPDGERGLHLYHARPTVYRNQ